jgi:urease accessory protein
MVDSGRIVCSQDLAEWLDDLLRFGSAWSDAVLFAETWNAASDADAVRLAAAADLGEALAPSAERLAETMEQGTAFLKGATAWTAALVPAKAGTQPDLSAGHPPAEDTSITIQLTSSRSRRGPTGQQRGSARPADAQVKPEQVKGGGGRADGGWIGVLEKRAPYPVAVAAVCAAHGIACEPALAAYLHAFAANQVSAAIRLVPLGQSDGLAVLARLEPLVLDTAGRAARSSLDDLGSANIMADIAAMNHETGQSRLFRS